MNNRDWAALIWLLIVTSLVLLLALRKRDLRSRIASVVRIVFGLKILVPLLALVVYVVALAAIGRMAGIWNLNSLKGTIIWFVGSALVLFFSLSNTSGESGFFRRTATGTLKIGVFVEFYTGLAVLSLPVALALQPALAFLGLISVVGRIDSRIQVPSKLVSTLLVLASLAVAALTTIQLLSEWDQQDGIKLLLDFALPVWLTIGILPFIYVMAGYVAYELSFVRVDSMVTDSRARRRVKLALLTTIRGRLRDAGAFGGYWVTQAGSAGSFAAARDVIKQFLDSRRKEEAAIDEENSRLDRYVGVAGADADGRQLDRREFTETTKALHWLATCQMGWHNQRGKYHDDLLEILGDGFRPKGLPDEHEITMHVAEDGQSWWAWRRTISGWYFAIGAAGPTPDSWEFDGPEPPDGFPRQDDCWGDAPFSQEFNPNW